MKAKMVYVAVALALVFSLTAVIMPASPAQALNIEVTNTNDSGPGSLRQAINDSASGGTINFTVAGTITLSSQLAINKSLTITGPGEAILAISGNNTSRVFHINGSYTVSMSGMTIGNGNVTGLTNGGGLYNDGGNVTMTSCTISGNTAGQHGGGIYNNGGNMTMTSCTISGNTADDDGGGLYNYAGNVTMTNCTISDNEAGYGGGLYNDDGGNVTMTNCTISDNTTEDNGGGLYNDDGGNVTMTDCTISDNKSEDGYGGGIYSDSGNVTMTNCTVSGNTADWRGGGIYLSDGTLTMTNCTVSGNTVEGAGKGGGIYNYDELTMTNCTVSDNTAEGEGSEGGGIYNDGGLTMTCTIVYGNMADSDPDIGGYSFTATESIVGSPNPLLDPLQDNGGPTETHALLAGSPAIDGCTGGNCTVETDQRGVTRPQLIACDVGAYEKQPPEEQIPVGGIVEPVDRLSLLAPWLGLAALMAVAVTIAVVVRRRTA